MKTNKFLMLLSSFLITSLLSAQKNGVCYTDEITELKRQQNPELIQKEAELEEYISNFKATYDPTSKKATMIIPVVVHNITHDGGEGYVSKADIDAQIASLNEDFQGLNVDMVNVRPLFQPYIATLDIEFRLARLDPNGNCTEGIVRAESQYSYNTSSSTAENVKYVSNWDPNKYFNIWVIDAIQDNGDGSYVAGYAQFPSDGTNNTGYGIVCVNQNFNGSDRTMIHEFGHCFNLYHTFQGGCGNNSCSNSGDRCCDTPPTDDSGFSCAPTGNSCSQDQNYGPYNADVEDQFENHMSYASCRYMFTLDQKTRMMAVLTSSSISTGLAKLYNPSNLSETGTNDPYVQNPICVPLDADFTYNKEYICEGDQVTFADFGTYNATPTLWDWTFTGGTPSNSNVSTPSITYNTEGVYGVSYSPGTTAGFATPMVKNNIITVSSITANYTLPFSEGMENTTTFANEWTIETQSGSGWLNNNTAAYTGSRSLRVYNYSNSSGDITEAKSPSYDLSTMTNPKLEYKWSFARKTSGGNDQFIIYYSTDCGNSWSIKAVKAGSSMATVAATDSPFTPSSSADWKTATVDLSTLANESNVRFKLYFKNAGGNNFFLDDLNIFGDVFTSVNENEQVNNLKVYPNPTKESAIISFNLTNNVKNLKIVLRDVLGQEVTQLVSGASFSAGKYTVAIDQQQKLSSGLYFIEFNADNNVQIEKLIVE